VAVFATAVAMTAGVDNRRALISLFLTIPALYLLFILRLKRSEKHETPSADPSIQVHRELLAALTFRAFESVAPPDALSRKTRDTSTLTAYPKLSTAYREAFRVLSYEADRSWLWHGYFSAFVAIARVVDALARFSTRKMPRSAWRDEAWHRVLYSRAAAEKFRSDVAMCRWENDVEATHMQAATEVIQQVLDARDEHPALLRVEGSDKVFYIVLAEPPKSDARAKRSDRAQSSLFDG
jgi:hypothetical protein